MDRKQRVKSQMKKIRAARIAGRKENNLMAKLRQEAEKISNSIKPFVKPKHIPFETIELEVSDNFPSEGVVEYKFKDCTRYAEIVEKLQIGKEKLIDVAKIRVVATSFDVNFPQDTVKCILKSNKLFAV